LSPNSSRGWLSGERPTAAVDGTGLESGHTSRYFFKRAGRTHTARRWTKLTVAADTASHFLAGARVSTGPSNDSPQFQPVMAQASLVVRWDRVLADAAFDNEAHHRDAREELGVRSLFQGDRMTAALLDRLTHRCEIFEMNGESYRFRESMKAKKGKDPRKGK
jgi:hypothetical protein